MASIERRTKVTRARLLALLFPRRCPFCGALLGADAVQGTVCPACLPEEMRLQHLPPRLPEGEHAFYALGEAAAAYYYADAVRGAILRCKRGGRPWYAQELADRMAVLIFGALPARRGGAAAVPRAAYAAAVQLYCAGAAQQAAARRTGLPLLLARRLSAVLGIPVVTPLYIKNPGRPQKELTREERLRRAKAAFACRPGTDLTGKRVLLVDDIITTGATASACAAALLQAGAIEVTAAAIAATEELPKAQQKKRTLKRKGPRPQPTDCAGCGLFCAL